jgi:hypothetical protein
MRWPRCMQQAAQGVHEGVSADMHLLSSLALATTRTYQPTAEEVP